MSSWVARALVQTMVHTAQRVERLHMLGLVHRNLKPSNVLRVPRLHSWTLIDFGSAARIGAAAANIRLLCAFQRHRLRSPGLIGLLLGC